MRTTDASESAVATAVEALFARLADHAQFSLNPSNEGFLRPLRVVCWIKGGCGNLASGAEKRGKRRAAAHVLICLACGGPLQKTLARLGSLRCLDCREENRPLDAALVNGGSGPERLFSSVRPP